MNKYRVSIYNGSDALVYKEVITSNNENEALIYLLKNVVSIASDDKIFIEYLD